MKLEGRIALVTGGSRGSGGPVAEALAREGNYRSGKAEAEEVVQAIEGMGRKAIPVQGDVAEFGDAERMVEETVNGLGGLHILVNNAGIARDLLVFNMEPNDWLDVMRVNFGG